MKYRLLIGAVLALFCTTQRAMDNKDVKKQLKEFASKRNEYEKKFDLRKLTSDDRILFEENIKNERNFLLKYFPLPEKIANIIDNCELNQVYHKQMNDMEENVVCWGDNLSIRFDATKHFFAPKLFGSLKKIPGVIFKGFKSQERIVFLELVRDSIKKNKLDDLGVPKKYLHKIKFGEREKCVVLAEKLQHVISKEEFPITLDVLKQFEKIALRFNFYDWGSWDPITKRTKNIIFHNNKFVLIDTEKRSFTDYKFMKVDPGPDVYIKLFGCLQQGCTKEAKDWLIDQIKACYKEEIKKILNSGSSLDNNFIELLSLEETMYRLLKMHCAAISSLKARALCIKKYVSSLDDFNKKVKICTSCLHGFNDSSVQDFFDLESDIVSLMKAVKEWENTMIYFKDAYDTLLVKKVEAIKCIKNELNVDDETFEEKKNDYIKHIQKELWKYTFKTMFSFFEIDSNNNYFTEKFEYLEKYEPAIEIKGIDDWIEIHFGKIPNYREKSFTYYGEIICDAVTIKLKKGNNFWMSILIGDSEPCIIDFEEIRRKLRCTKCIEREEQEIREKLYESSAYGGGFIGLL